MSLSVKPLARWLPTRSQGPGMLYHRCLPRATEHTCSVCNQAGWGPAITGLRNGRSGRTASSCLPDRLWRVYPGFVTLWAVLLAIDLQFKRGSGTLG